MIICTYALPNGEYQTPFGFNTIEEMVNFFGNDPKKQISFSCSPEELPQVLRALRQGLNMTLQQVADGMVANYDRRIINNIEAGRRKLGLTTLTDISQSMGFGINIEFVGRARFENMIIEPNDLYDEINPEDFQ